MYEGQGEDNYVSWTGSSSLREYADDIPQEAAVHAACMEFDMSGTVSNMSTAEVAWLVYARLPPGIEACTTFSRRRSRPAPMCSS